jgi:hypothetical protein
MAEIKGGEKFEAALSEIARMLGASRQLKVGFLSTATYPNGTPVALIAAIQNFGAPRAGIPPRPFFSDMVKKKSPEWPAAIGKLLVSQKYDAARVMQIMGEAIAGQLRQSIVDTNDPPLAPATIRRKGFDKPLVHTGHMLASVDYEVKSSA